MARSASYESLHPWSVTVLTRFHSTVAVALWALDDTPVSPSLQLSLDAVFDGGVGPIAFLKSPSYSELRA